MQLLALLLNFEHKKRKVDVGRWVLGGRFTPDIQRLACDSKLQHPHAPCHNLGLFRVHVLQIYLRFVFKISHYRPLPLSIGLNGPEFRHSFFIGPESDHCLLLSVTH